jgi:argininosuccinate lyase
VAAILWVFSAAALSLGVEGGHVNQLAADASAKTDAGLDEFYWLGEFNKASTVMVVEQGIVTRKLGKAIADAVAKVIADGNKAGAARPSDYLELEKLLVAAAGPDVTRMHSGRSRQDLIATSNRTLLRVGALELMQRLNEARNRLQSLSRQHIHTIVPAYTNGVQAQPITLAHYLLAFDAALAREGERIRQAYPRLNLSPLGSAALGTSSFPVNRVRLAELLGFDGVAENSFDATQVSSLDVTLELISIAQSIALSVGPLIEDIEIQYRDAQPWILLREGTLTGPSSIMPQKRNPYGLISLRQAASQVVGDANSFTVLAHNVARGMLDYKRGSAERTISDANALLVQFAMVFDNLVINPKRALDVVNADYSTTTELANILQVRFDERGVKTERRRGYLGTVRRKRRQQTTRT